MPPAQPKPSPEASRSLAERVEAGAAALAAEAGRPEGFLDLFRRVNAAADAAAVGAVTLDCFAAWFDAPVWAIVAAGLTEQPAILTERGLAPGDRPACLALAAQAFAARALVAGPDLSAADQAGATRGNVAFPLLFAGRCSGVVVAIDPRAPTRAPELAPAAANALAILTEPLAVALDQAIRLARAEALSVTDDLTRLYNSRYLNLALRREVKRAARNQRPLSLLFIDLDGFKLINDTYGHLAGSRALVEAGGVIRDSARETDVVARFGGDEFALVLPDTNAAGARAVAERVCQRVSAHRFVVDDGRDVRLTASVGIATLPEAAGSPDALMQAADLAMYRVKERGKNGIEAAPVLSDT